MTTIPPYMLMQTNENTACGHDPHWLYPVAPYDAQCLLCDIQEIQIERDALKAESARLTAYDGSLALMPFEEWQTLTAETRARINAYGLKMETLQKEYQWIPVSERLPETSGEYFVYVRSIRTAMKYHKIVFYNVHDGKFEGQMMYVVTHWQPLPEPPQ